MEINNDIITNLTFGFTLISTLCLMYISYKALVHTAKPRIRIKLLNEKRLASNNKVNFKFHIQNIGHWYGTPIARDITVFCNFSSEFKLNRINYGSRLEDSEVRFKKGKLNMKYYEISGIYVGKAEEGEYFTVETQTPRKPGNYKIRLESFSENGVSYVKGFAKKKN